MKTDLLALLDTYVTAWQWAERCWYAALALAALLVILIGYLAFDRIGASFTRAQRTIADIQQAGEGENQ
ncbi:hypothetical protein [Streptomyces formicae]